MKLSIAVASIVASGVYAVLPRDADNRPAHGHPAKSIGVAYFQTNQPEGNYVVSADIGEDAKLTYRDAAATGGGGAHCFRVSGLKPDALFSVNPVLVAGQHLFAVNAGSHTLSMFNINKADPAKLTRVGHPVDTGGEFPISITVSPRTGQVCVLNGGKINGVKCFHQDPKKGLSAWDNTTRLTHVNQTTPANGPEGSLSQVAFTEDGHRLLVTIKGLPMKTPGRLAIWDVDPHTGALSKDFVTLTGGVVPFSMTPIPGTNALLTTDPGIGYDIWDFKNPHNATVQSFAIANQGETCWSSFSPKTGNFYFSDFGMGLITEAHVDGHLQGTTVKQYVQPKGSFTTDNEIITINKKNYLYFLNPGVTKVAVMALDAPGKTSVVQMFDMFDAQKHGGIKIDGNNTVGMSIYLKDNCQ